MKLLYDENIVELLERDNPIIENYDKPEDWYCKDSLVQPSSLDLHFGEIFIPDDKNCLYIGNEYILPPGSTVFIKTKEILKLPANIAAFGFPPTEISSNGILMTNPGHIDPGYNGTMSFTLINMGKKHFSIKKGNVVVSLLLVELSNNCNFDYAKRKELNKLKTVRPFIEKISFKKKNKDIPEQLSRLSKDFLDIEKRAKKVANKRITWVSFIGVIIVVIFPFAYNYTSDVNKRVSKLENKINTIEKDNKIDSLKVKIERLEEQLKSEY